MAVSKSANEYYEKMFPQKAAGLSETDPEYAEIIKNFALDEVINEDKEGLVDDRTRFMAILATLLGCQGLDLFKEMIPAALNFGVTAVEIKEIVYQATDYLGLGRVYPFVKAVNACFEEIGISLPLEGQSQTTTENRLEKGIQAQVDLFGEGMKEFYKSGPEESRHINRWLAGNCFGDYYTRKGLDYKQREMITFCFISAQGGCEPQLTSHAAANLKVGNSKAFMIQILSQCLPYIGYLRSLNALRCLNEAAQQVK